MIRFHLERQEPFVLWPFCNVNSVCWYGDSPPPTPTPQHAPGPPPPHPRCNCSLLLLFFLFSSSFILSSVERNGSFINFSSGTALKSFTVRRVWDSQPFQFEWLICLFVCFCSLPLQIALTSFVFLSWGVYGVLACLCAIYVELIGANCDIRLFCCCLFSFSFWLWRNHLSEEVELRTYTVGSSQGT